VGVKVKYKTKADGFPSMKRRLDVVNGTGVEVGVLKGEHAWLASIHEYGCDIPVTEKMRVFLHYQGLHLSSETTQISIPARPFLAPGYDKHRDEVLKKAGMMLADVAAGRMSAGALYSGVGIELSDKIKDYATALASPGNHPFTTDRKGSGNPLVDSGDMIGGITWRKS